MVRPVEPRPPTHANGLALSLRQAALVAVNVHEAPQVGAAVLTFLLVALVLTTLYGRFRQPHPTG